ncbi:MAG: cbb3-type cytochrome oxidase assembly protein CcoS [Bdellovibrionaceae bacterium]|nr:cbb3-type cytochrome oxidase assembly protein CcoS [Pseudobdellovibrionaceae bacterium]|tara:strand:+ start:75 stop:248 length:174 start_codon:yes stop_codon:yes gene_type:complete
MNILVLTIPVTTLLVALFVLFFMAAVKGRQFDDLETPAFNPLLDDEETTDSQEHKNA